MSPSYSDNGINPHPVSFPNSRPTKIVRSTSDRSLSPGTLARENLTVFPPSATAHPAQLPEHCFLPIETARRLAPGVTKAQALLFQAGTTQYKHVGPKTTVNPYLDLVPENPPSLSSKESPSPIIPFTGAEPEDPDRALKRGERVRQRALEKLQQQREEQLAKVTLFPSQKKEVQRPLKKYEQRREDAYEWEQLTRKASGEDWARKHHHPEVAKRELREQQERERVEEEKRLEGERRREIARGRKDFDAVTARELERKGEWRANKEG
ncbi:uncharacterized protein QC763_508645 [Podospora pseudopauciseta]|uniref:Uncharacterized protein n=1 Tax=Podospora pseudopauciseta TaxID=2093780 RepID=A0ABR0HAH8_9PEZI|nr:hypothetical protein QC763_508645 [Podospora pseudopauciseta]